MLSSETTAAGKEHDQTDNQGDGNAARTIQVDTMDLWNLPYNPDYCSCGSVTIEATEAVER